MHPTLTELRAAREWCETQGFLLTPRVVQALGALPCPEIVVKADTVRSDLIAASWGNA
jgi:hypothetical protein